MIASTSNHPLSNVKSAGQVSSPLETACARLKAAGLRITQPRIAILEALIRRESPVSIEQLHQDLSSTKGCDLVTVYRCLAAFENLDIVRRSFFHNGTSFYEFALNHDVRYHVVSRETQQMEHLDEELSEELRKLIAKIEARLESRGYAKVSHIVEFFGNAPQAVDPANRLQSVLAQTQ